MRFLTLGVVALLTAAALGLVWQGLQAPPGVDVQAGPEPPRYALHGVEWVRLGRQGTPEFRARAGSLEVYADESVRLAELTVDALGGWESPWHLEAAAGRAPPHERRLELTEDVRATGRYAGDIPVAFTTDRLWVDLLRRELRTEAPVELDAEWRRARARGLRADFSGERLELLNEVQVDYVPPG